MDYPITQNQGGWKTWHIVLIIAIIAIILSSSVGIAIFFMRREPEPAPPPPPPEPLLPEQKTASEASDRQTKTAAALSDESVRALEISKKSNSESGENNSDTQGFLEWLGVVESARKRDTSKKLDGDECVDDVDCDGFEFKCDNGYCKKFSMANVGDIVQIEFNTTSPGVCASNERKSRMTAEGLVRKVDHPNGKVHIKWYALKNQDPINAEDVWKCSFSRDDQPGEWIDFYFGDENTNPEKDYGLKSILTFKEVAENIKVIPSKKLESTFPDPILIGTEGCYHINNEEYNDQNVVYIDKQNNKCRVPSKEARIVLCKDNITKANRLEVVPRGTKLETIPSCDFATRAGPGGDCSKNGVCLDGSVCRGGRCFEVCDKVEGGFNLGCTNASDVPKTGSYFCNYDACATNLALRRQNKLCYCCTKSGEKETCSLQPVQGCTSNATTYCKFL